MVNSGSYTALNVNLSNLIDKNDSKPENKQKIHLKNKKWLRKIDQAGGPEIKPYTKLVAVHGTFENREKCKILTQQIFSHLRYLYCHLLHSILGLKCNI